MARQILNRAQRMGSPLQDDAGVLVVRVRESKNEAYWTPPGGLRFPGPVSIDGTFFCSGQDIDVVWRKT